MTRSGKKGWRTFGLGLAAVLAGAATDYGLSPEALDFLSDQVSGAVGASLIPAYLGLLEYVRNRLNHG